MDKVKSFEDLLCWQKAREVRKELSVIIQTLPEFEKYDLISQMRRASRSVTHNIAEGYGRYHYKAEEIYKNIRLKIVECITVLNGYINYLTKAAQ